MNYYLKRRMKFCIKSNLLLASLLFGLNSTAHAQVASSTLLGEVHDESGALAPAVTVTARNNATGFVRTAATGPQGAYRIDELLPGEYTVTAEKSGFRTMQMQDVVLQVNQKARLDLVLTDRR